MDTQQISIVGKHILIASLIAAGLEVAEPIRDRGIDLIAFRDRTESGDFLARPIQLKTATDKIFGLDWKYKNFSGLRIVFVWNVRNPVNAEIFALSYEEASDLLKKHHKTRAWKDGKYTTTRPSKDLKEKLRREFQLKDPSEWPSKLGWT